MHPMFQKESTPLEVAMMSTNRVLGKKKKDSSDHVSSWVGAIGITTGGDARGLSADDCSSTSLKKRKGGYAKGDHFEYFSSGDNEDPELKSTHTRKLKKKEKRRRQRREKELASVPAGFDLGNDYLPPIMQAAPPIVQKSLQDIGGESHANHEFNGSAAIGSKANDDDDHADAASSPKGDSIEQSCNKAHHSQMPPIEGSKPHCAYYLPPILQSSLLGL